MAKTVFISDRNLYFDNRKGLQDIDHIVDDATGLPAAKYVNAGKPIPRAVFDKFKMAHPVEDKNASAEQEDKGVTTSPTDDQRRRRVVGSANAEEVKAAQAEANETPVAPVACGAVTGSGGTCTKDLNADGLCQYDSHNEATGRTAAG